MTPEDKQKQLHLTLDEKIKQSKMLIMDWYYQFERTGCMFCMYGLHCEKNGETRFDKMKQTHPKQYDYCMNQLGLKTVIDEYLKCSPRKDSK